MKFFTDLIDLLLPESCAGCGGVPILLCDACAVPLRAPARPVRATPDGLPPPWTVAAYEDPLRSILAAYKEHGRTALAVPLGEALARSIRAALAPHLTSPARNTSPAWNEGRGATGEQPPQRAAPRDDRVLRLGHDPPIVVWVPSRRRAVRRRGHDAVQGLVDVAAGRLRADGVPVIGVDALKQRGRVADQAALTATQRTANLQGALEVKPQADVAGRLAVLVDDVVTTGASLGEAARALRAAGADLLGAATVAATPRRRP
ncbi:phosphoribosyltransferase family protein [Actinomadura sp. 7K507]|uniref:ComF family protein n=1 Tax=Actinomadura sp. 7K507 TaxID=2530365 RepID=UPI0010453DC8|nr:phosphoribosyltransferase family protein [Actinomadura sp. 7K507]TDC93265.1 ComF family protein [Actinomadura sp. 7K507]